MRKIGGAVRGGKDRVRGAVSAAWRFFWNRAEEIAISGTIFLAAAGVFWLRRRRRRGPRKDGRRRRAHHAHPVAAIWTRTASRLSRRGWTRNAAQTPREFAAALAGREVPGARPFSALTELYYGARFGETAQLAPAVDLEEARRLAEAVVEELKASRRAA